MAADDTLPRCSFRAILAPTFGQSSALPRSHPMMTMTTAAGSTLYEQQRLVRIEQNKRKVPTRPAQYTPEMATNFELSAPVRETNIDFRLQNTMKLPMLERSLATTTSDEACTSSCSGFGMHLCSRDADYSHTVRESRTGRRWLVLLRGGQRVPPIFLSFYFFSVSRQQNGGGQQAARVG